MVKLPFLFIAERFVSFVYFQELLVVRGIGAFIGVKLVGQFVIGFFDLGGRSIFRHTQNLVIILQRSWLR